MLRPIRLVFSALICCGPAVHAQQVAELAPEILKYDPFVWKSEPPEDCPFEPSESLTGIRFLGIKSGYRYGDTWYLVAHGADISDTKWRFWNASWINGDQVYLIRVTPSIETINDASKYEFFGGRDAQGNPILTHDFAKIKPLLEWNNNMGCVTVTYNAPLKKYIMCVTDGGNAYSQMNTYLLESDQLTGQWKLITSMKHFGEQCYFVNIPTKFISKDGHTAWLLYPGNYWGEMNGENIKVNPPGSHYGMTFQKINC